MKEEGEMFAWISFVRSFYLRVPLDDDVITTISYIIGAFLTFILSHLRFIQLYLESCRNLTGLKLNQYQRVQMKFNNRNQL